MKTIISILTRAAGIITFLILVLVMVVPYIVILFATNYFAANICLFYILRLPINWWMGNKLGDYLYMEICTQNIE